jgi:hypothetical protein
MGHRIQPPVQTQLITELTERMTFAFQKAKGRWAIFYALQLLMASIGIASPFLGPKYPIPITAVSFALAASVMISRLIALHAQGRGESLLRALRWFDAFGVNPEEILRLLGESDTAPQRPGSANPQRIYFAATHEPGWERYAANCAESSHSTQEYAKAMIVILGIPVVALVISALVLLFSAITLNLDALDSAQAVSQIVPALLTALLALPLGDNLYGYYNLSAKAKALFETAIRKEVDGCQLQLRAADYDAALSACPPVPDWLYKRKQPKLDGAWTRLAAIYDASKEA